MKKKQQNKLVIREICRLVNLLLLQSYKYSEKFKNMYNVLEKNLKITKLLSISL